MSAHVTLRAGQNDAYRVLEISTNYKLREDFVFAAAAGCGIWMARAGHILSGYRLVISLLLLSVMTIQLILGTRNQYMQYHTHRGATILRVPLGGFHMWLGRILLTLGIINGGLGFAWSASSAQTPRVAYEIIATVVWVAYIAINVGWMEVKKGRIEKGRARIAEELDFRGFYGTLKTSYEG